MEIMVMASSYTRMRHYGPFQWLSHARSDTRAKLHSIVASLSSGIFSLNFFPSGDIQSRRVF